MIDHIIIQVSHSDDNDFFGECTSKAPASQYVGGKDNLDKLDPPISLEFGEGEYPNSLGAVVCRRVNGESLTVRVSRSFILFNDTWQSINIQQLRYLPLSGEAEQ